MRLRFRYIVIAALAAIVAGMFLLLGATSASAGVASGNYTPPAKATTELKVVDWKTTLVAGVKTPHGEDDVVWPQTLVTEIPKCGGFWIQEDTYKYDSYKKDAVDALIKHGTLDKTGQWSDKAFVISWKFIYVKPCETTPPPSSSTPPPSTSTPPPTTTTPADTPTPVVVTSTPELANTGFQSDQTSALGGGIVGSGIVLLLLAILRKRLKAGEARSH